ncbi:MAG TPA: hypothetical protein VGY98_08705 [Verrucomicrobiae bacterium]|nr:hypothetical protein [Verrucomicrobiae bacterium]
MHLLNFNIFAETIAKLPAGAILKALELESKMLEYEWENYRLYLPEEAYSIFCFRQFVRHTVFGKTPARCMPLPRNQVEFYRQTVVRLIEAKELPESALEQFEQTFSSPH